MPLSPSFAATSRGTGTRQPPPPRGVGVSLPLNVTITPILSWKGRAFRKRPWIGSWCEIDERRRRGRAEKDISELALGLTAGVEGRGRQSRVVPAPRVESLEQNLDRRDRFRFRECAVAGAMDEGLAQQGRITRVAG